jgi:hypothetical protein
MGLDYTDRLMIDKIIETLQAILARLPEPPRPPSPQAPDPATEGGI